MTQELFSGRTGEIEPEVHSDKFIHVEPEITFLYGIPAIFIASSITGLEWQLPHRPAAWYRTERKTSLASWGS